MLMSNSLGREADGQRYCRELDLLEHQEQPQNTQGCVKAQQVTPETPTEQLRAPRHLRTPGVLPARPAPWWDPCGHVMREKAINAEIFL